MKKGFGLLILMGIFTFAMISCGGEKKADDAKEEKTEVTEETSAEATPEIQVDLVKGEETYNLYCHVCHKEGIAGSPKLGDKELWAPRAEKGMATLIQHVNDGFSSSPESVMPPKGTCMTCEEDDFRNAITFMLKQAGLEAK